VQHAQPPAQGGKIALTDRGSRRAGWGDESCLEIFEAITQKHGRERALKSARGRARVALPGIFTDLLFPAANFFFFFFSFLLSLSLSLSLYLSPYFFSLHSASAGRFRYRREDDTPLIIR